MNKAPLDAAIDYLRRYAVTRWELARWMRRKGYDRATVRDVVITLKRWRYLRDRDVLEAKIHRAQQKLWSRRRTAQALRHRGIPDRVIRKAIRRWYSPEQEWAVFVRWVKRLPPTPAPRLRTLARRSGFPGQWVRRWLSILREAEPDEKSPSQQENLQSPYENDKLDV